MRKSIAFTAVVFFLFLIGSSAALADGKENKGKSTHSIARELASEVAIAQSGEMIYGEKVVPSLVPTDNDKDHRDNRDKEKNHSSNNRVHYSKNDKDDKDDKEHTNNKDKKKNPNPNRNHHNKHKCVSPY